MDDLALSSSIEYSSWLLKVRQPWEYLVFWVVCMLIPLLVCWDFDFPKITGCAGRETITGTWQSSKQEMKEKKLLIIH